MTTTAPRIAVIGAGAVGCWAGALLAMHGARVTLIGRPAMVDAVRMDGLTLLRGEHRDVVPCDASTDMKSVRDADVVLLCVKSTDTLEAATALAPLLDAATTVVSLQNGVDNADRAATALAHAVHAAAVYVGCEIAAPGVVRHLGRGDLFIGAQPVGEGPAGTWIPARIAALFSSAGIPCLVVDDIAATLWQKLIINCAYNAMSALSEATYGALLQDSRARLRMQTLAEEAIAVAHASGVSIDGAAELAGLWRIGEAMPGQLSSTAQDLMRGRRTEIDALNGHIAARGRTLGVPTPLSSEVTALIKLLERAAVD